MPNDVAKPVIPTGGMAGSHILLLLLVVMLAAPLQAQTTVDTRRFAFCPITTPIPLRPVVTESLKPGELFLTADQAESIEGGVSTAIGDAELSYNRQQLTADRIDYHQPTDVVELQGNVHYWDDDVYLSSIDGHVELETENADFNNVSYWLLENRGRGKANSIHVRSGNRSEGQKVDYTTCDPDTDGPWNLDTNIWKLSMSRLYLNHDTDQGSGRNVVLRIKDIPVFYTPWMSFPISSKRKSGFLFPGLGSSTRNGAEIQAPWYWNIAPDMDATITPRAMSNIGVMLAGQFRYLMPRGQGTLDVEYLPNDSRFDDKARNSIAYNHSQMFLSSGYLGLIYNRVSDQRYLEDFSSSLLGSGTQFLEQSARTFYGWNLGNHWLGLSNLIGNFQTVDRNLPVQYRPYKRLPSTTMWLDSPYKNRRLNYNISTQFDYFTRGNDELQNSVNGIRYDLAPTLSLPVNSVSYFVEPRAGMRLTRYHLDANNSFSNNAPDRVIPFFSVDSGVFLERNTRVLGDDVIQTLEPRLYYLYVPEKDQSDLPVFDTGEYTTTLASLFYENRYNGLDRIGDANQITAAATSRFYLENTGEQLGYFSVGQAYFLDDRSITLPGQLVRTEQRSAIMAELGATPSPGLELRTEYQWDPYTNRTSKLGFNAMYRPAPGKVINVGYRDLKPDPYQTGLEQIYRVEQTDISFRWPVRADLSIVGKWNYAIEQDRSLDLFAGFEFNSCCWGLRMVGRRFLSNIDGEFESGVFLQFELKGLAGIGEKTVDFLTRSIPGYESEF
jgi:LPS-assembly protein